MPKGAQPQCGHWQYQEPVVEAKVLMVASERAGPPPDARLRWRCRRGLLELDLILKEVLDNRYSHWNSEDQAAFQVLLETPDNQLLAYLHGREEPGQRELKRIIRKIL